MPNTFKDDTFLYHMLEGKVKLAYISVIDRRELSPFFFFNLLHSLWLTCHSAFPIGECNL